VDESVLLSDYDLYLLGEGNHHRSYDCLGAHVTGAPVAGAQFAVWAPHARRVSVVGDFNDWDSGRHPMRPVGGFGLWATFVPGALAGQRYKYRIETVSGAIVDKTDPYEFAAELRPGTASMVPAVASFRWSDQAWMQARTGTDARVQPISIYELHLGSWRRRPEEGNRWLTYREIAPALVEYVVRLGFTHVELLPITEHPLDASWGYQVTGYFAPTSRYGEPADFAWFVDYCHQHSIGVLLDWVPGHFPRDASGLARFDGTALYENEDTRKGEHREWGTLIFNYARNEVRNFLLSSALFWLDRYHLDGLRVDAVAPMLYLDFGRSEWEPNEHGGNENLAAIDFFRRLNDLCHRYFPGVITVAEDSSVFPGVTRSVVQGGLGFTFKWNMGWMNDSLEYISTDPLFRKQQHEKVCFGLKDAYRESFVLPISHDEVVHLKRSMAGKMPGDLWQQMANLRLFYGYMWTHPGKKLLFMGQEFGQWREWSEGVSLDWHLLEEEPHRRLQAYVSALNRLYKTEPALYEGDCDPSGFRWVEGEDRERSVFASLRLARDPAEFVVAVCNFTPVVRPDYRIGVPMPGRYMYLLNSDSTEFGGSGIEVPLPANAEAVPCHEQPYSIRLTLPPLAVLILKPQLSRRGRQRPHC
jgi:1,4-alpha-glucan branching enzyme